MDLRKNLVNFARLNNLKYLENYNVILKDSDHQSNGVKLISGGGSGHYPFPNGLVGQGMLDAAVCGEIYTSPSVSSVLAAIMSFSNEDEILVIINNYTGDRLNFGLAVETAKSNFNYGKIRMLIVDEDCSIDEVNVRKSVGKRGMVGSCLIIKIAGAMSEEGHSLDTIFNFCQNILETKSVKTISFGFKEQDNKITNIEMGRGIHGEPGVYTIKSNDDFQEIVEFSLKKFKVNEDFLGSDVVLLVNNLGGATDYCLSNFVEELLSQLDTLNLHVKKIFVGIFLTSLNTEGISVTLMKVDDPIILKYLDATIECPVDYLFNKKLSSMSPITSKFEFPDTSETTGNSEFLLNEAQSMLLTKSIRMACETLIENKLLLNQVDAILADGDTGSTLSRGAQQLLNSVNNNSLNTKNLEICLKQIGDHFRDHCGGSIGILYSIFFVRVSRRFQNNLKIENWPVAIKDGIDGIMKYGLAELGERTMLDSLSEGQMALERYFAENEETNLRESIKKFADGCEKGSKNTISMIPRAGRSAYTVSGNEERNSDQPDAGALAIELITRAIMEATEN